MRKQQKCVLVMGANGRLGHSIVEAFAAAGWQVRAQMRNVDRWQSRSWPESVEPLFCDATDRAALCHAADGAEVLVNALNPLYTDWKHNAFLLGDNALAAARSSGALLLFPGTIYNFGKHLPEVLYEETSQIGNTPKGRIRIAMETAMYKARNDVNSVVLRAGDYFGGSGRGAWFDMVITKKLSKDKVIYPGPINRAHAWAYLPDFAQVFVKIASIRAELHGFYVYHFPGHCLTGDELHHALEQVLGKRLHLEGMPWWKMRFASFLSPMLRAILEMRYLWEKPHRLDGRYLSELIGNIPKTPLRTALYDSLVRLDKLSVSE